MTKKHTTTRRSFKSPPRRKTDYPLPYAEFPLSPHVPTGRVPTRASPMGVVAALERIERESLNGQLRQRVEVWAQKELAASPAAG